MSAGNSAIHFLRGTQAQINASTAVPDAGQPIYATDTNYLYVGNGSTQIKSLKAIKASTADSLATAGTMRVNLASTSSVMYTNGGNITPGITGTLPISHGGTGLTSSPSMLVNLGSTTADTVLEASPRPGITGTLGVAHGGTGETTAADAIQTLLDEVNSVSSRAITGSNKFLYKNGNSFELRQISSIPWYLTSEVRYSRNQINSATQLNPVSTSEGLTFVSVWGLETKQYGKIFINTSSGLELAGVEGEHGYWGKARLFCCALVPPGEGCKVSLTNMEDIKYLTVSFPSGGYIKTSI